MSDQAPPPNNTVKNPSQPRPGDPGYFGTAPGWPAPTPLPVKKGA